MGIMDNIRAGLQVVQREVNGPHGSYMRNMLVRDGQAVAGAVRGAVAAGRGIAANAGHHVAQAYQGAAHAVHEAATGAAHAAQAVEDRVHHSAAAVMGAIGTGARGKGNMGTGARGAVNRAADRAINAAGRAAKRSDNAILARDRNAIQSYTGTSDAQVSKRRAVATNAVSSSTWQRGVAAMRRNG